MIKFIIEVLVVLLIVYGIWREDDLVEWEDRLFEKIKNKIFIKDLDSVKAFSEEDEKALGMWWAKR